MIRFTWVPHAALGLGVMLSCSACLANAGRATASPVVYENGSGNMVRRLTVRNQTDNRLEFLFELIEKGRVVSSAKGMAHSADADSEMDEDGGMAYPLVQYDWSDGACWMEIKIELAATRDRAITRAGGCERLEVKGADSDATMRRLPRK